MHHPSMQYKVHPKDNAQDLCFVYCDLVTIDFTDIFQVYFNGIGTNMKFLQYQWSKTAGLKYRKNGALQ